MGIHVQEIAFSCYPVTDFVRARAFYEEILGLKPSSLFGEPGKPQWAEYEIGPAALSIGSGAPGWSPGPNGASVALEVADFDAAVAHLRQHAVSFRLEPVDTPVCRMAAIADPDGNSILIHQRKAQP